MANCAARFMDNNLALPETARITASSALAAFPYTNAYDQRRSRHWMTGGNFEITASNRNLYINDGTDKTVQLTVGSYTYATLAAHIQTQLNASSSNWTCSYSTTTRKFTAARASGTRGFRFSQTTNAIWSTLGMTSTADEYVGPFVSDFGVNHTSEWYKVDFVIPQPIQAFMGCWAIGMACPFSRQATVKVSFNNIDQWDSPALTVTLATYDRGIFSFFEDTDTTYRFARFEFEDRRNPCGPEGFYIGNLYFGSYRTMTVSNVAPKFGWKLTDRSKIAETVNGSEVARLLPKRREYSSLEIQIMDDDERRGLQQMVQVLGNTENFYFSLDPTNVISEDLDENTFYASFDKEPDLKHVYMDRYTFGFDLKEVI